MISSVTLGANLDGRLKAIVAAIVICGITAASVALVQNGPVSEEGRQGFFLVGLIYDYQTLITGLLAIFAAIQTIRKMHDTDAMLLKMHRQALYVEHRAEIFASHRLADRLTEVLQELFEYCKLFDDNWQHSREWSGTNKVNYYTAAAAVKRASRMIEKVGESEMALFTLPLERAYDDLATLLRLANSKLDVEGALVDLFEPTDKAPTSYSDYNHVMLNSCGEKANRLRLEFGDWMAQLLKDME